VSQDPIVELVNQLTRLPGIGEKTAARLAYHIVEAPEAFASELSAALLEARAKIQRCDACGVLTGTNPCRWCAMTSRTDAIVCVVETTQDVFAIERTGEFDGRFHVLHGLIRPLDGIGPDQLNLDTLIKRVGAGVVSEVIVATNPSVEGEATAMYLRNLLVPLGMRVTRIASGLPLGGELEYADRATLGRALNARVALG
jgi:recombination protein RecR